MLNKMTARLDFHSDALVLRAERQRILASNIANADTPNFVARDFDFPEALRKATRGPSPTDEAMRRASVTDSRHMQLPTLGFAADRNKRLAYTLTAMPAMDDNTVDMDRDRANFADNAVRYEATLRFLNGANRTMLSAITGQ